jgi:hypothetical protein
MTNNITCLSSRTAFVLNRLKQKWIITDAYSSESEEVTAMEAPHPLVLKACLIPCQWMIHDLSKEFEFGFHGFKLIKDWTAAERG